jgi:hypothetical protein
MGKENFCNKCRLGPCSIKEPKCDGLEEELEKLDGMNYTEDFYGGNFPFVSAEGAAETQMKLQDGLDDQFEDENRFPEDPDLVTKRGLPPCKRVKKSF